MSKPRQTQNQERGTRPTQIRAVTEAVRYAQRSELVYGIAGLVLGALCIGLGTLLTFTGVAHGSTWSADVLGFNSELNNAPPGVVALIAGVFIVWMTRPRTRARDLN